MPFPPRKVFPGFPREGLRFLAQLKKHNDREWFQSKKEQYKTTVELPMTELVLAVAGEFQRIGLPLHAKEKNPVMRVYRDIRFSKDKTPYKTHVAADLRRSFSDSTGGLYLHFSPAESLLAAGIWQPERPLLQAWREAICSRQKEFEGITAGLNKKKLTLSDEGALTTMPRGFQNYADQPLATFLKLTSFVTVRILSSDEVTAPDLVPRIVDFAQGVRPLLEFGWRVEEKFKARTAFFD